MYQFNFYFLIFFSYSILGYFLECISVSLTTKKLTLNRGFLLGPYLPIYGVGALLAVLFLNKYVGDPFALFTIAAVGASVLEYFTSWLMEKLFKARWWDYSDTKYNINGRVTLKNTILFGVGCLILLKYIHPSYKVILEAIPDSILIFFSAILFTMFLTDFTISFLVIRALKLDVDLLSDSTHKVQEQVKVELRKKLVLTKRLLDAFPNATTFNHEKIMDNIREFIEELETNINKNKEKLKKQSLKIEKRLLKEKSKYLKKHKGKTRIKNFKDKIKRI